MPGTDRVEIRTLKVGRYCVVDDEAYKILSISKSKPESTVLQRLARTCIPI